ncbi:hypothetical protein BGX38DRAFT_728596 [Terfezia claveryi]|nr:hypothetical protein BGX38DRAFT_728596 [Terfezia claveryi]
MPSAAMADKRARDFGCWGICVCLLSKVKVNETFSRMQASDCLVGCHVTLDSGRVSLRSIDIRLDRTYKIFGIISPRQRTPLYPPNIKTRKTPFVQTKKCTKE